MPTTYIVEIDGKTYDLEGGETPPTEAQARLAVSHLQQTRDPLEAAGRATSIGPSPGLVDRTIDALPVIGGMVGGAFGGVGGKKNPVGMTGAAIGGAGGEGLKETANALRGRFQNIPETISGRLTKIAGQGIEQAGLEGLGRGTANLLGSGARFFMNSALRPGLRVLTQSGSRISGPGQTISSRFPKTDIVGEALTRGRPIRDAGLRTTEAKLTKASEAAKNALAAADARGVAPIPVDEALAPARTRQTEIALTHSPKQKATLKRLADEYATEYPAPANMELSTLRKQHGYAESDRLLRTGKGPMGAQFQKDLGQGYQAGLETRIPEIKGLNAETQTEMALKDAIFAALNKESQSSRWSLYGALDNPRLWGSVAHGSKNLGKAATYSPQAARAALIALMQSHEAHP